MRKPYERTMPVRVLEELAFQFDILLWVPETTVRPLSLKQWREGSTPAQTPVRQACHVIGSCEAYATGAHDGCGRRFG